MGGYSRSRTGLTLIQLVQLIAATGLLAALLFPLFTSPREYCHGCGNSCLSHLKQLGLGMMMYAQDYDECYLSHVADEKHDWGVTAWNDGGQHVTPVYVHNSSPWIAQLLPYVKGHDIFQCPEDVSLERNHTGVSTADSRADFPVSYGPNLMFTSPRAYGRKKPVVMSGVDQPGEKYLLGDCTMASGFDLETIAYLRYPNYDPTLRQNGWSLDQFTATGRAARPQREAVGLTRHQWGSNIAFADGRVKWVRHDQIPNNDRPYGTQYRALEARMVPWSSASKDSDEVFRRGVPVGREER